VGVNQNGVIKNPYSDKKKKINGNKPAKER
jgi:hypothetical protein